MIRHGNHIVTYGRRGDSVVKSIRKGDTIIYAEGLSANAINVILNSYGRDSLNAILDYVKLHPNVIPFVNEDPQIVCSLVDTGYERWIVTDGAGYFVTSLYPLSYPITIQTKIYFASITSAEFGFFGSYNGNGAFEFGAKSNKFYIWSRSAWSGNNISAQTEYDVTWSLLGSSGKRVVANGETVENLTSTNSTIGDIGRPIGFFTGGGDTSKTIIPKDSRITCVEIYCNGKTYKFIPFRRKGYMEMLEINTGNISIRHGAFTELILEKH